MAAEYGDYVYNQRLFHLYDARVIDERDLVWESVSQMKYELGSCQARVKARTMMLFFCGIILFALGCAAIGVNFVPASYGYPEPLYMVRPVYVTATLMGTGIVLCLGALFLFECGSKKIIFYERGFVYVTLFGIRRQTVMYRDIRYIEKHFVRTSRCRFDSYIIHTGNKNIIGRRMIL